MPNKKEKKEKKNADAALKRWGEKNVSLHRYDRHNGTGVQVFCILAIYAI